GRTSRGETATMNLSKWQDKPVFRTNDGAGCHGNLSDSLKARGGEPNPLISEEGRRFLLDQFHRLTTDHIRAIFSAARGDRLHPRDRSRAAATVDAWVGAFKTKSGKSRHSAVARRSDDERACRRPYVRAAKRPPAENLESGWHHHLTRRPKSRWIC